MVSDAPKHESDFQLMKKLFLDKIDFAIQKAEYVLKVILKDPFAITKLLKNKGEAVLAKIRKTIDKYSFKVSI